MYGYVFLSENLESKKKYIGICRSVKFIPDFFGDTDAIQKDVANLGPTKFTVKMLMPYETEEGLIAGEQYFLNEYNAKSDSSFYNAPAKKAPAKKKEKASDE